MRLARPAWTAALTTVLTATALAVVPAAPAIAAPQAAPPRPTIAYRDLKLPGAHATVYSDGLAEVSHNTGGGSEFRWVPLLGSDGTTPSADGTGALPSKDELIADLAGGPPASYRPGEVVVIYQDNVQAAPSLTISAQPDVTRPPQYTSQAGLNTTLARLGVDRARQLFTGQDPTALAAARATAQTALGRPLLDFPHAYVLHIAHSSVPAAVTALRANPAVAYAAPNWTVTPTNTRPTALPASTVARAAQAPQTTSTSASGVPSNYALSSSAQALLNRPGVNAVPAYTALAQRYHQLPGQGETITNVSLGTLDDASAAANPSDPCNFYATAYGPTTELIGGQRYLDWPAMPLIPTYTSDAAGTLDPTGETCGDDPSLTEIGLDFSMMSPLPHGQQRPDALGSGLTDLLGIAPGADYRLVAPSTPGGAVTDVDAAFLAAAQQKPRPDVITASLGFGYDQFGFSARYLEDDPMTEAVIATIVHSYHIVVCLSGGDGLRGYTNAAVPPSGGSVATDLAGPGEEPTSLDDVGYSSVPSADVDSGAIDVGSTTLDDIFSAPPQDAANAGLAAQHAFPETRYNGFREFASAYGSRVNVSAPGDNVLSLSHAFGQDAKSVQVNNEGGTSASAPEAAAAAAIVLQVARLTGNKNLSGSPVNVRSLLAQTASPVPALPQSDLDVNVGPQIDVGNAVATLLAGSYDPSPAVPRVAVEQRQQGSALGGTISTATDPANVSLAGKLLKAWITISPDWVGVPAKDVTYRLAATTGPAATLAGTPWARVQPAAILAAAGLPLAASSPRTVQLTYTASRGGHVLVAAPITLTLGPTDGTSPSALAPVVPAVATGPTIPVSYDLSQVTGMVDPTLVVSEPGRVDPVTGQFFRPAYSVPLTAPSGVVQVPVSALPGAGIYGIGVQSAPAGPYSTNYTAFAFTRVAPTGSTQPPVPSLSYGGSTPGHYLDVPYHASFQLGYDVRSVPGATGAAVEVSAAGPTSFNNSNPFNNPNGSQRDNDGSDFGSVSFVALPGTHGTATLSSAALGMYPSMTHVVRVLATRDGTVTGEASGVSAAVMDGVVPADGGNLANGYAINSHGTDGFLTSNQVTAAGQELGSVQTFDQTTNAITSTVTSSSDVYATLMGGCPGIAHGDVGLYDDGTPSTDTFRVLNPVASGTQSGTWTPPSSELDGGVLCPSGDQTSTDTAVLAGTGGPAPTYRVFTSNAGANTFGPDRSIVPAISSMGFPIAGGIAQNSKTGEAIVGVGDFGDLSQPPAIVSVNLRDGTLSSRPGVTTGAAEGVAVDENTNTAVTGSLNYELGIYDLGTGDAVRVTPGGGPYEHPAIDSTRGRIAIEEISGPDFLGQTSNNNALSSVLTLDEHGNVLQRIERFNFFNIYLLDMGTFLQLNPTTGIGYTLGPGGTQLHSFSY